MARYSKKTQAERPLGNGRILVFSADARVKVPLAGLAEGVEVSSNVGCFYFIENCLSELMPYSIGFRRRFAIAAD